MKNFISYIVILGCLALIVPGCAEGPELPVSNPEEYITFAEPRLDFNFSEGAFTRAELVDEINEFTVWGYCIPRNTSNQLNYNNAHVNWQSKSGFFTNGPDVLNGITVTVEGSNTYYDQYSGSGPAKWYSGEPYINAANYNYGFIAAASTVRGEFNMVVNSNVPGEAHPILKFTLNHTSDDLATELDPASQPDALIGTKFDQRKNSTVNLMFKHIMTGLRFRFHNQTSNSTLTIHKVTFAGQFYNSCDFSFVNEEWHGTVHADDTYSGTFVLLDNDNPQTIAPGSSDLMRHEGNPSNSSVKLLLLPNPNATLTPSEDDVNVWALGRYKKISIEYSIDGGEHKVYQTEEDFHLSYIPDANTLHTANFHFTGNDFVVTFVPDNNSMWYDGSNSNLEIH